MRDLHIRKIVQNKKKEELIIDAEKCFTLAFIEEINAWIMCCAIFWICVYDRYYLLDDGDVELYRNNRDAFLEKYNREISRVKNCFTERFIGSDNIRDYDGVSGFQYFSEVKGGVNPFMGYTYLNGVFYAKIAWKDNTIYVPPTQAIQKTEEEWIYPLRDQCEVQTIEDGTPVCYKYKFQEDEILSSI